MEQPVLIEMRSGDRERPSAPPPPRRRSRAAVVAGALGIVIGTLIVASSGDDERPAPPVDSRPADPAPRFTRIPELTPTQRVPDPAHAARCYAAQPSARHLRTVFEAVGGFEGLRVATASGAFEVVTFDALDPDRLLAAQRGGYGPVEHQDITERWTVVDGVVRQTLWNPGTPHDFAHFNTDGTLTMWVHAGENDGVAPRLAITMNPDDSSVATASAPLFADRFAVDGGTVFALTGGPDWYTPRDTGHGSLVADDGRRRVELTSGADLGWIDVPVTGALVAYTVDPDGRTTVWDTTTLDPLPDHPLAGRQYRRVAVSGDGTTAVGVTVDGELEPLDLASGRTGPRFGRVDVREVDRPIVLSADGAVAFSVERSGAVSVWFVGDDVPIAAFAAGAGVPRWLPTSRSAARLASALAPDGTRLALRIDARPQTGVTWRLIDTDVDSWLARARALDPELPAGPDPAPPTC